MPMTSLDDARTIALTHAVFRSLHPVLFRRAEDGTAAMVVSLGAEEAVLPLRAVRREFGIAEDSEDGRMLALVEQALDYVAGLKPGEALPPEVLGGSGFEPTREQQLRAVLRVREALGAGVSARAVAVAVEELAAVESLRATLIERVAAFRLRTDALARAHRGESQRALSAAQVARLARVADARLGERFNALDEVDTGALLRTPGAVLPAMQAGREVLHRNRLAWTPTLDAWDRSWADDWPLVERTYRFLAPRYMSTTEWRERFVDMHAAHDRAAPQMIW
jgi:hypothetical protein